MPTLTHVQLPRPQQLVTDAPHVVPSRNQRGVVAALPVVLGSDTVQVLVTEILITRGTRAFGPAKHDRVSRESWTDDSQTAWLHNQVNIMVLS